MATPSGLYRNPNAYDRLEEGTSDPYFPTRALPSGKERPRSATSATLDISFFDLPLVLEAGPLAAICYLGAYLWTLKHGTGGVIPAGAIGSLADWGQLDSVGTIAADRCVQVGLMQRVTCGYLILDYHGTPR